MPLTNSFALLEEDESPDSDTEPAAQGILSASSGSDRDSTIVARGQMDGQWCDDMLIDTGASCSFVRRSWIRSTRLPMAPLKQSVTVTLADRRTAVATHEVQLKRMAVHGSVAACTLLVMDELSNDVIVGLNWQRATGLTITPGNQIDKLNGQPVLRRPRAPQRNPRTPDAKPGTPDEVERPASGPVRLTAALVHAAVASTQPAAWAEEHREMEATRLGSIQVAAAGNLRLQQVLKLHQHVFTEVLPIKTAAQIAEAVKFSIVLLGDNVKPVKQHQRRLSPAEIEAATKWVKEEVSAGRMEPSSSQWAAQLVIVPKRNDKGEVNGWRICGDYRNLNAVTKADAEPLPLMQTVFDQLAGMQWFSKLDLLKGFNQIPVDAQSRELMAVSTPAGLYQPTVMPFGVKNAPGSFQREMRRVLKDKLNKGVFVYIDDIILYSRTEAEQLVLIDWVLSQLRKEGYFAHPGKCQFLKSEVNFLGHVVSRAGVSMQQHKVEAMRTWPALQSVKDVRAFLGLAGFYRRFVKGFSEIARPLTDLTKIADKRWFSWGQPEQHAFDTLKQAMVSAPVLAHPDPRQPWIVQSDASGFAIGAVLSQKQTDGTVRPVAYWSHKLASAPRNYSATERELMAIVEATKHWRCYLHGSPYPIQLLSDHKPLVYLNSKAELGQRLSKWMEQLCDLEFEIKYVKGKDNAAADALSRRSDHVTKGADDPAPARWKVKLIDASSAASPKYQPRPWRVASGWMDQPTQSLAAIARRSPRAVAQAAGAAEADSPMAEYVLQVDSLLEDVRAAAKVDKDYQTLLKGDEKHDGLQRRAGLVYSRSGAVYIPSDRRLKTRLMQLAHDAVGHFGRDKTIERLHRHCVWPGLTRDVVDWIRSCSVCCANKGSNELPAGLLKPLPIPEGVWDSVGLDFVGPLPKSNGGYDFILVLIDRFSKMVKLRACHQTISGVQTGRLLLEMMLDLGKLPSSIVSDRDVRFTGAAWGQLWRGLNAKLKMSTAYHPQTDGQTEKMNSTMQTVLRSYAERREDWDEWLPFVAAAYNSTQQESTKRTPFELNFHDARSIDPLQWAIKEGQPGGGGSSSRAVDERGVSVEAERTIDEMKAIWDETRARLVIEQAKQKQQADRKRRDVKYDVGDQVWLSTKKLTTYRGKLQDKWVGPYVVTEVMSAGSVRLDLNGELGKTYPVFHVSRLKPYEQSVLEWPGRLQPNRPAPVLVDGEPEYEVESIIGKKTTIERKNVTRVVEEPAVQTRSGRVSKPTKPATRSVTTVERVPVVWYKVLWRGWDESDAAWKRDDDLEHCRHLIDEYELLVKQAHAEDDGKATVAVVELGMATVMQCELQDRRTTTRRGKPTVRCAYLSAVCLPAAEAVAVPRVSVASCGQAVVSSAAAAGRASDPCVLGWSVQRSRAVAQAWTDRTKPLSPSSQGPNRLSQMRCPQPPKPSG
jgi:predicted aspartyl protease